MSDANEDVERAGAESEELFDLELPDDATDKVVGGNKVNVEYKPQKADGSLDAGVFFKYDLKAQKEA
jgi:hypothetical protein